jgi:hypothetical protein
MALYLLRKSELGIETFAYSTLNTLLLTLLGRYIKILLNINIIKLKIINIHYFRFLAPRAINMGNNQEVYLNLNLAWEVYKDVKIGFL